jgi:CMP-N-acetylneuraminic acid synthetase
MGSCKSFDCEKPECLAVIPARGGSKGVPRKGSRLVAGRSLLARAIAAAKGAKTVSRVIVSTDDPQFAELAKAEGAEVPFLRPPQFATDAAPIVDAIAHLLETLKESEGYAPEFLALLQPTSPFTLPEDVDGAFKALLSSGADAAVTLCQSEVKPDWLRRVGPDGFLQPFAKLDVPPHTPRQAMPKTLRLNGAVYWVKVATLLACRSFVPPRCAPYEMPALRSVDIDSELDLLIAGLIAKEYGL